MNSPNFPVTLPDMQSSADVRDQPIDAVGVKDIRYPITIWSGNNIASTIALVSMTVGLPATVKGTHMSRFIELLESHTGVLEQKKFKPLVFDMLEKLDAATGEIEMRFPFFLRKTAPVSGAQSLLDYDVCWRANVSADGEYRFAMRIVAPVTSLCPCSKEISDYGAHNQRSHISIDVQLKDEMAIDELIAIAEQSASCEIYGLLKRPDEKYVTERAYDNPKFVEDLVRDVALGLNSDKRIIAYSVEVENFESIHNHSAFARITRTLAA